MAASKELTRFTRAALSAGHSRAEVSQVLRQAGWAPSEIEEALSAWADMDFAPPVPRPVSTLSARDFFIYALTFGVMLIGAIYLVALFHALIDLWFDDPAYRRSSSLRWAMAVLIVTLPVYLWLTLRERRRLAEDPALYRSAVRKWLTYLTLLGAAAVLLGDLVAVIYAFLSGDMTVQFMAKAAIVALVAGLIFLYYLNDIR
ncbi:MAG: DUF5671 domain-containing protein, partial [Sulfitobacter sp.]|nr:DUF5671 domain-containing protein [Sulfitobacter sp.]